MSKQIFFVIAVFVLSQTLLISLAVPMAGVISVAVTVLAITWLLRRNGESWADLGLARPARLGRTLLLTLGVLLLAYFAASVATVVAMQGFGWAAPDYARLADLVGNPAMLLLMLGISWTTAAFGEEMLFRGFLQSRLQQLFARIRGAKPLAVLAQAGLFGIGHAYQGPTGILVTGTVGLVFGSAAVRLRSLWPVILAHGLMDTVSMLALFSGFRPGA